MTERFVVPAATETAQRRAADPGGSAWVSANAGSGKTFVLARRVVRLLLAGAEPSRILCLTFTKAAAATMANRVFDLLGRWTRLADDALAAELAAIEGRPADPSGLDRARRLFARAIETPGGLKIQTIHGFCERILQQFPLEADLGGAFEVLDTPLEAELVEAARDAVLIGAAAAPAGDPLAAAFARLVAEVGEFTLLKGLAAVVAARDLWRHGLRDAGTFPDVERRLAAALGVDPARGEAEIDAAVLASPHVDPVWTRQLLEAWRAGGKRDGEQAERLALALDPSIAPSSRRDAWTALFLTQKGRPKAPSSFASKAVETRLPDVFERAAAEAGRLAELADARAGLATFAATRDLLRLGDAVIAAYEAAKRARGVLDFDDLVGRTADLLSRSDAAAWVQYKLDRGIDHVLVDEAQDTSPRQWRIVRSLTEEFFAGRGARTAARTIFAVGDEKQSIYSFQGAAPRQFSETRRAFARRVAAAGLGFADVKLDLSFRSTRDVLAAVDRVFADEALRRRLLADPADYVAHAAARGTAPGLVEIWPMIVAEKVEDPEGWRAPIDQARANHPWEVLARRIAAEIARLLAGTRLEGTGAPVRARDVVVLVRKRGPFVEAMNRVLKEAGLPVAGQDRLRLTDHVAVADLLALGRALALPEDDLSLAAVLKSPLFDLDDDDLVDLARADRRDAESLVEVLRRRGPGHPRLAEPLARLERWRDLAGRLPPYELFMTVLAADGGRRRFLARLGSEADDVLDEFMALALGADRGPPLGLARFLEEVTIAAPEIRRELDETRDEIRVMTVHGAKGLEAPVVFLVDGGAAPVHAAHDPELLTLEIPGAPPGAAPALVWNRRPTPAVVDRRRDRLRDEAVDEYHRLLYVAMTRAADRLYVCGHAPASGADPGCWHALIEHALAPDAEPVTDAAGAIVARRWRVGPTAPMVAPAAATASPPPPAPPPLPAWIAAPPPSVPPPRRLTPSQARTEAAETDGLPPIDPRDRLAAVGDRERRRGLLVHRLLERLPVLPAAERRAAADRLLAARAADLDPAARRGLADEVVAVLDEPAFAALFGPEARAEVAIVGRLSDRRGAPVEIAGRIDRLVVTAEEVRVVDFKSDRRVAGASEAHVAQLALYRRLLRSMFPGRRVRAFLLWTTVPALEEIAAERLDAAETDLALS